MSKRVQGLLCLVGSDPVYFYFYFYFYYYYYLVSVCCLFIFIRMGRPDSLMSHWFFTGLSIFLLALSPPHHLVMLAGGSKGPRHGAGLVALVDFSRRFFFDFI